MRCVLLLSLLSICALSKAEHRRSDDINILENLVQQQASTIENLKARLDAQDNKLQEQTSTVQALKGQLNSQDSKLQQQASTILNLTTKVAKQGRMVAFHADMSNHQPSGDYSAVAGEPLKFNSVVTNLGNAYNSNTGIFTAPYSGLYIFYFHFMGKGHYTNMNIKQGFNVIAVAFVNSGSTYEPGSATAIIQLSPGEKVTVQYSQGDPTIAGGANAAISFSGALIHSI